MKKISSGAAGLPPRSAVMPSAIRARSASSLRTTVSTAAGADRTRRDDGDDFARFYLLSRVGGPSNKGSAAHAAELRGRRYVAAAGGAPACHRGAAFLAEADTLSILTPARRALHARIRSSQPSPQPPLTTSITARNSRQPRRASGHSDRQRLEPARRRKRHPTRCVCELERRICRRQFEQQLLRFDACERRTDAEVHAAAERELRGRIAVRVEPVGIGKAPWIAVR